MGDQVGTTQQPSAPARSIGTEHGYLIVAAIAASLAGLTVTLDTTTDEEFDLGIYVLLGTLFAVGVFGWLVRSEGAQRRREHAELRELLGALTDQVRQLRADGIRLRASPTMACTRTVGRATVVGAAQLEETTVPLQPRIDDRLRQALRPDGAGRSAYWRVYSDVLEDLGGLDGDGASAS